MLNRYIKDLCEMLKIAVPEISYDNSVFATDTTLACCKSDGSIIHLKNNEVNPDLLFAIAHELRHLWQLKYKKGMLDNYKDASKMSLEEYNLQPAELDANAFGVVIMANFFKLEPQFNNLSEKVKKEIRKKVKNISL